jgi:hypothetical protein
MISYQQNPSQSAVREETRRKSDDSAVNCHEAESAECVRTLVVMVEGRGSRLEGGSARISIGDESRSAAVALIWAGSRRFPSATVRFRQRNSVVVALTGVKGLGRVLAKEGQKKAIHAIVAHLTAERVERV